MVLWDSETDIVIIGGGVVGTAIARELSRYEVSCLLLEKECDLAMGTSKANTAIVHAGYDPKPGSLMARLNLQGNEAFEGLCQELDVPFRRIGSLVIALNEVEANILEELKKRGEENGTRGLEIISGTRLWELEPNLTRAATAALYAPSAGITSPVELTIALAENAFQNGVDFLFEAACTGISVQEGRVAGVTTTKGSIKTRYVINAAGLYSDEIASMAGDGFFRITPRKGEYYVLDKTTSGLVRRVIFPVPTEAGKGVTVTPTVDGNILVGPNALDVSSREDTSTSLEGLRYVAESAKRLIPSLPIGEAITQYAGLRAVASAGDFIIGASRKTGGFINVAGIQSPGLSAAPAIGKMVVDILRDEGLKLEPKPGFDPIRHGIQRFREMSLEEKARAVEEDPDYGYVVCRCETVTKREILDSIRRPLGAKTLDGVKQRTRAGMGRCQGGFCLSRVADILARELGVSMEELTKSGAGSRVFPGRTRAASGALGRQAEAALKV